MSESGAAGTMGVVARYAEGTGFVAQGALGQQVVVDSAHARAEPVFSPMEMVLVALAGCLGLSILPVLQKMRLDVTSYDISVRAERTDAHPRVFTAIAVVHDVTGRNLTRELVERAVQLGETRACSVSAMLAASVPISHTVRVRESAGSGVSA